MASKLGLIADVRYQDDKCIVHVDCGDGVHTATLPKEDVEKYGYKKGLKVDVVLSEAGGDAVSVRPIA